jgi:hypothetical protein
MLRVMRGEKCCGRCRAACETATRTPPGIGDRCRVFRITALMHLAAIADAQIRCRIFNSEMSLQQRRCHGLRRVMHRQRPVMPDNDR